MQVRNRFMVALVLAGGVVTMPALADNKPAKSAMEGYQSAWQLWSKGDSVQAEKALQKLVVQFPQDSHLGLFLAANMAAHASEAEAETYFSRVIELGVKSAKPSPDALAAQHFLHLGDPDSANEAFSSLGALAQKNRQNPVFVWLYAQAAERMQKPELAEQAFKALIKSTKSAPAVVRQGYADALEAQGKHFFALEHRLKITSAESTPATLHALSGNLKNLDRFTEAASVAALQGASTLLVKEAQKRARAAELAGNN